MDKIKIHGVEVFAHHGLFEDEAKNGQKFILDCEFSLDTSLCREEIGKTVHYGEVTLDIVEFVTKNRYDLLETLANDLVKSLLKKYKLMSEIKLIIHKPNAPIPTEFADVTLQVVRKRTNAFLGLGSNLGDKKEYLDMAIEALIAHDHVVLKEQSKYIETEPYGVTDQPEFLNAVVKIETYLSPFELLELCQSLEEKAGRKRLRKWGERTLDVDILLYGNQVLYTEALKIPHPELHKRSFVLEPLCEIEPYFIHPIYKKNITELYDDYKE